VKQIRRRQIIRAGTTVEQMVRAIADMIVTGVISPGERLDEISLALRFDVSRTPVREALRELGAMGLVDREPNRIRCSRRCRSLRRSARGFRRSE
jgi:DNA-binding GntR family transcriptional regulator